MRLFLAIDIPNDIKKTLADQIYPFQKDYQYMTWVPPENFHLTIYFFGEVDSPEPLKKMVEEIAFDIPPFRLYALEGDIFIADKITLSINFQREKNLNYLVKKIRDRSGESRREFVPHLTIARYKKPSKQQYYLIKKKMEKLPLDVEIPVTHLTLFESNMSGSGPHYKNIAEFPLNED